MSACIALSGISLQILNTDLFISANFGHFIIISLWSLFLVQSIFFAWALKRKQEKISFFYPLPFLAFICMAISLDLITLLLGLTMFAMSFVGLSILKNKDKTVRLQSIRNLIISFLAYSYGLACLYSREGTIQLNDLYLKLNKGNWDGLTSVGAGLLFLSVLIAVYSIIPLIGKKK